MSRAVYICQYMSTEVCSIYDKRCTYILMYVWMYIRQYVFTDVYMGVCMSIYVYYLWKHISVSTYFNSFIYGCIDLNVCQQMYMLTNIFQYVSIDTHMDVCQILSKDVQMCTCQQSCDYFACMSQSHM